ncbi:hypothetical protein EC988_009801, partial [Linderina pennispora]
MTREPSGISIIPIMSNNVSESSTRQSGVASSDAIDVDLAKRNGEALTPLSIPQGTFSSGGPPSATSASGPPSAPLSRLGSPVAQDLGSFSFAASVGEDADDQQKQQGLSNTGSGSKYYSLVTSSGLGHVKSMR